VAFGLLRDSHLACEVLAQVERRCIPVQLLAPPYGDMFYLFTDPAENPYLVGTCHETEGYGRGARDRKGNDTNKAGARTLSLVSPQTNIPTKLSDCDETSSTRPVPFVFEHWHGKEQFFFDLGVGEDIHAAHLNGSWWLQVHGESCSKVGCRLMRAHVLVTGRGLLLTWSWLCGWYWDCLSSAERGGRRVVWTDCLTSWLQRKARYRSTIWCRGR
jgi:hypothetical protein